MEVNKSKCIPLVIYFISCFLLISVVLQTTSGSCFKRFEFVRYLSPFNGSLRERKGFDWSSSETGTNMS